MVGLRAPLISALLAFTACGLTPEQVPDVISPDRAVHVVYEIWAASEKAGLARDAKLAEKSESGVALGMDAAAFRGQANMNRPLPKSARPLNQVTAFVPHQQSFPAHFVAVTDFTQVDAEGKPTAVHDSLISLFEQDRPGKPWRVVMFTHAPGADVLARISLDGGWARVVPDFGSGSDLALAPKTVASAYADYLTTIISGQNPSASVFAPTRWTDFAGGERDILRANAAQGLFGSSRWSSSPEYGTFTLGATDGGGLTFLVVKEVLTWSSARPTCLQQAADYGNFGGLVPPGRYGSIAVTSLAVAAAVIPAASRTNITSTPSLVSIVGLHAQAVSVLPGAC
jgi:hypothetical protein